MKSRYAHIAILLALVFLSFILFPQAIRTFIGLHRTAWTIITNSTLSISLVKQIQTPLTGEQALPPPVQSMIALLRSNQIEFFRYSETIEKNEEFRQRVIEGALPIRYAPNAHHLILFTGEPLPQNCWPIAGQEGVTLAYCP
jgi:hypothetical protein